jgi:predicted small integral membrane protein
MSVRVIFVDKMFYKYILHFTFLFSLFVFVSAAGHYFRIWTGSIWTGQVPALF